MKQYHDLLKAILENGTYKEAARKGMPGTTSLFGYQFRHDLKTFPILTTKKIFWKGVIVELLWFLKGDTNVKYLIDNSVNFWNQDAYNYYLKIANEYSSFTKDDILLKDNDAVRPYSFEEFENLLKTTSYENLPKKMGYIIGDCGFQYGKVWRNYGNEIDQIKNVIKSIKNEPNSRRHIVSAIDPCHDKHLALYWCHSMFQFNCRPIKNAKENEPKYFLDCQLYQRSGDVFLGVPMNIASYALLTHIIAKIVNMIPGDFIHTFGDVHIYDNHKEAVLEQLSRDCYKYELPILKINSDFKNLDDFLEKIKIEDFELINYQSYPTIKAELSTGMIK